MTAEMNDTKVVKLTERGGKEPALMPVTRLISRPSVRIVDGRLAAVMELALKAA